MSASLLQLLLQQVERGEPHLARAEQQPAAVALDHLALDQPRAFRNQLGQFPIDRCAALARRGVRNVGVFTELKVDKQKATAEPLADSPVWVLIPYSSLDTYVGVSAEINTASVPLSAAAQDAVDRDAAKSAVRVSEPKLVAATPMSVPNAKGKANSMNTSWITKPKATP